MLGRGAFAGSDRLKIKYSADDLEIHKVILLCRDLLILSLTARFLDGLSLTIEFFVVS